MDRQRDAVLRPQEPAYSEGPGARGPVFFARLWRGSSSPGGPQLTRGVWTLSHLSNLSGTWNSAGSTSSSAAATRGRSSAIAEAYWDVMDQLEAAGHELCEDTLKEVTCLVSLLLK